MADLAPIAPEVLRRLTLKHAVIKAIHALYEAEGQEALDILGSDGGPIFSVTVAVTPRAEVGVVLTDVDDSHHPAEGE